MNRNLILIIIIFIYSCGISDNDYKALQTEAIVLQLKVDSLLTVINELKKTPSALINQAELQVKTGDYESACHTLSRVTGISITAKQKITAAQLLYIVNNKLEDIAYNRISISKDAQVYRAYLKEHPKSRYTTRVKNKIKKLTSPVSSANANKSAQEQKTSYSKDFSSQIKRSINTTNNWNTTSTSQPPKSYNKPASNTIRTGAVCCDGSRSYATGRGACSHHGGVCQWLYQ